MTYDLRRSYAPTDLPLHSYRVGAKDFAIRAGTRLAMLVASDGVTTLDLDTGCLRHLKLPIAQTYSDPPLLAAIDSSTGQFFAISGGTLVRVDASTLDVTTGRAHFDRPERELKAVAHDPVSKLVFLDRGHDVLVLDATTLDVRSTFKIPNAATVWGGPYVRPGHAEAMYVYEVACRRSRRQPPPMDPLCLDPVDQVRVARVDLVRGAVTESHPVRGATRGGSETRGWSGDGKGFVLPLEAFVWEPPSKPAKVRLPDDFINKPLIYKFELDPTGTRYAEGTSHWVEVSDLASGKRGWSVTLPHDHVKQK